MYYVEVTKEELDKLREGLSILDKLEEAKEILKDFYLYGLTSDAAVLDAAREAIAAAGEGDLTEEDVQVAEVVVMIPISSDVLYYLVGSGLKLQRENFVYNGTQGEGTRELGFNFSQIHPQITLAVFSNMALATTDSWGDRFLRQHGGGHATQIQQNVQRAQPAVTPSQPNVVQRQSSKHIAKLVEDIFG